MRLDICAGRDLPVITPVTDTIGANVTGLSLRADHSDAVREVLKQALHQHGVLFIRAEEPIDDAAHLKFATVFGELHEGHFSDGPEPVVKVIDNAKRANVGTERWHSDTTVIPEPPAIALLRVAMMPEIGGDTLWASMYAAYEALSPKVQRFLDGLEAVHTTETLMRARPSARETKVYAEEKSAIHPVVIRDTVTGRPALYVNSNYTARIVGFSEAESDSVLRMLFEHVNTPEFHVRHKWDTQTLAVWQEHITQHRAVTGVVGRRVLNRVWIKGGPPAAYGDVRA